MYQVLQRDTVMYADPMSNLLPLMLLQHLPHTPLRLHP